MLSPQALIRGLVARTLPAANPDGGQNDVAVRLDQYGGMFTQPVIRKSHVLADEGSYFTCNSAQTAVANNYSTSYSATAGPLMLIYNQDPLQRRLYLDYVALQIAVALVCTTTIGYHNITMVIDNITRYSSAGTNITGNTNNVNMGAAQSATGITIYHGPIQALTASAAARMIVGQRTIRPGVSTTVGSVIGDQFVFNFGGVEGSPSAQVNPAAGIMNIVPMACPPVVIPYGSTFLLYMWYPVLAAPSAETFTSEIGFWLR